MRLYANIFNVHVFAVFKEFSLNKEYAIVSIFSAYALFYFCFNLSSQFCTIQNIFLNVFAEKPILNTECLFQLLFSLFYFNVIIVYVR